MKRWKSKTQVYVHFVWATYQRLPLMTPEIERDVFRMIAAICVRHKCSVLALNGVCDHVHLLVALHSMAIYSKLIKEIKSGSSHLISKEILPGEWFAWQAHYGAFSVSISHVPILTIYIENQKQHHAEGTTDAALEQTDEESEYDV